MKIASRSLEETRAFADTILSSLVPGDRATVVALQGDLGAGKTAFTQEAGKLMGVEENMHSPTFVIMKVYDITFRGFTKLIHIDAYRIEREEELLHLGWEKIMEDLENLVMIEWPENVPGLIPSEAKRISLKFIDEQTREIEHES